MKSQSFCTKLRRAGTKSARAAIPGDWDRKRNSARLQDSEKKTSVYRLKRSDSCYPRIGGKKSDKYLSSRQGCIQTIVSLLLIPGTLLNIICALPGRK